MKSAPTVTARAPPARWPPPNRPSEPEVTANSFNRLVLASSARLAMPIAVYPGLALTGAQVRDVVTNPQAQFDAQVALHERYRTPIVLSAMDLSAEAEAFGCTVEVTDNEIPSVTGRLVTGREQAHTFPVPVTGERGTAVCLDSV